MRHCVAAFLCAIALVAGTQYQPLAQTQALDPCDIRTSERVVAVGDIHGAHGSFIALLRAAELIDRRDRWIGKRAILIQTGDVLDRGADSRKTLDLLRRLERDARNAGGQVIPLIGNHEFMRMVGDWRYVSEGEYAGFRNADSTELREFALGQVSTTFATRARAENRPFDAAKFREDFFRDVPLGLIEMRQAFAATGEYGKWLRGLRSIVKVNGVLFMHGGISDEVAPLGCAGINAAVSKEMNALPVAPEDVASLLSTRESGPLWYRGLAAEPEDTFEPMLTSILSRMGARAIVIGHTPSPGRITTRFGGRVVQIDSGMLNGEFYPGGVPAALELKGDAAAAIYLDRREPLTIPTS
jgi:hypothetical protein